METDTETTPSTESASTQTVEPQATVPSSQEPAQTQQVETPQVEQSQQPTSSPPTTRPSTYYEMRQLKKSIKDMNERFNEAITKLSNIQPKTVVEPTLSQTEIKAEEEKLIANPVGYMNQKIQEALKAQRETIFKDLKEKELPSFMNQFNNQQNLARQEQEALELIFPKSSSNPDESWEERANRDESRSQMIYQIMKQTGLGHVMSIDPINAAKTILEIYESRKSNAKRTPLAPSKSQMGSSTSGLPIGGSKVLNADELKKQAENMGEQLQKDSTLLRDEKFMQKWKLINESFTKGS